MRAKNGDEGKLASAEVDKVFPLLAGKCEIRFSGFPDFSTSDVPQTRLGVSGVVCVTCHLPQMRTPKTKNRSQKPKTAQGKENLKMGSSALKCEGRAFSFAAGLKLL